MSKIALRRDLKDDAGARTVCIEEQGSKPSFKARKLPPYALEKKRKVQHGNVNLLLSFSLYLCLVSSTTPPLSPPRHRL
jgi:hypothetical protein